MPADPSGTCGKAVVLARGTPVPRQPPIPPLEAATLTHWYYMRKPKHRRVLLACIMSVVGLSITISYMIYNGVLYVGDTHGEWSTALSLVATPSGEVLVQSHEHVPDGFLGNLMLHERREPLRTRTAQFPLGVVHNWITIQEIPYIPLTDAQRCASVRIDWATVDQRRLTKQMKSLLQELETNGMQFIPRSSYVGYR